MVKVFHLLRIMLLLLLMAGCYQFASAQNIDLENAMQSFRKKIATNKKFKITGGVNASSTFASSTVSVGRDPFMYSINGNATLSWMTVSIPLNINLTNAGFSYNYQYPKPPSRLSFHPKYKWVQAHIGDFSMNFSPYTMSGFQMGGAGVDLQPKGGYKFSAFYARFQRAVPYTPGNGNTLATYKRMGAGIKVSRDKQRMQSSLSVISIKDVQNSLIVKPDSLQIYPKANLAMSIAHKQKLTKQLQVDAEFGISYLTNDVRAKKDSVQPKFKEILGFITPVNASTSIYKAFKSNLTYSLGSSNVGIGYERIDPGYQTLGAYYFTNDLENITINFAQQLFKNKLNLNFNIGQQHDDLKKEKTGKSSRLVTALNASINASKKFTSSLSYSNFQSFTNVKPQFTIINQLTPYSNLDTLDYHQLSQNANANFNFILRADKDKTKMLNINLSFQDTYDEQGGIVSKGNSSQLYNLASSYSSVKQATGFNFSAGLNATYNTIGINNIITAGPTVLCGKLLLHKLLRTSVALAYNTSIQHKVKEQEVFSSRFTAGYTLYKKHQLNLNGVYMKSKSKGKPGSDFSVTISYAYSF